MERRIFFNRLAAIIAGAAIAPRMVAELGPDPAKVHERLVDPPEPLKFDFTTVEDHSHFVFSGKKIAWDEKGMITCEREEGYYPRIYDMVLIQLLWDNNNVNVSALVTGLVGRSDDDPNIIHLVTLDKDAYQMMDEIVDDKFTDSFSDYFRHAVYFNKDHRTLFARCAYRGITMGNQYPVHHGKTNIF